MKGRAGRRGNLLGTEQPEGGSRIAAIAPLAVRGRRKTIKRPAKYWSLPDSLLDEMMHARPFAPPLLHGSALQESGALAFRRVKKRPPEILLISTKRARKWGIPKGRLTPHLSFAENAAKEAYEEAGVIGYMAPTAIGMYRTKKQSVNPQVQIVQEVWVYLLEVTATLTKWPEKQKRTIRWAPCETAAILLREPLLAHLCLRLSQTPSHQPLLAPAS